MSLRKLQLLAAAVTLNGAIALSMSPQVAQAASCSSTTVCIQSIACYIPEQLCTPPAGCQYVSATCGASCGSWPVAYNYMTCNYAPL
ncbi:MAG TPA: hypothetical protein VFS24_07530 [Steroidobacteraceae bacterium]|nr:hypothetical protein [Steroidobacteraceae bacterium]